MSRAGYDIREAVGFWERMKNQTDADLAQKYGKGGKAAQEPELFSTHPHVREEYGFLDTPTDSAIGSDKDQPHEESDPRNSANGQKRFLD
jgi:predicted Zn-dependent protease